MHEFVGMYRVDVAYVERKTAVIEFNTRDIRGATVKHVLAVRQLNATVPAPLQ